MGKKALVDMDIDILGTKKEAEAKKVAQNKKMIELGRLYRTVFDSHDGRKLFKDLMEFCMTFMTTMTGNSWTYFNEGKRAVGLHILKMREFGFENELKLMHRETYLRNKEGEENG